MQNCHLKPLVRSCPKKYEEYIEIRRKLFLLGKNIRQKGIAVYFHPTAHIACHPPCTQEDIDNDTLDHFEHILHRVNTDLLELSNLVPFRVYKL